MGRTTWVYIVTIALSVVGLWAILKAGSALATPPDLSGVWRIVPEDPARPDDGAVGRLGREMRIEQSGRYLHIRFAGGLALDLKSADSGRRDPGQGPTLRATDGTWTVAFRLPEASPVAGGNGRASGGSGELWVLVEAPESFSFVARRADGPEGKQAEGPAEPPAAEK